MKVGGGHTVVVVGSRAYMSFVCIFMFFLFFFVKDSRDGSSDGSVPGGWWPETETNEGMAMYRALSLW